MDIDAASEARLNEVYPDLAVRWRRTAEDMWSANKERLRVSDALRDLEQQKALYAKGRTAPGAPCRCDGKLKPVGTCALHPFGLIVTYARPGESLHHYGLALDSCFLGHGPDIYLDHEPRGEFLWREYGRIATTHGLTWGGAWSKRVDQPHVQMTYALTLQQVKELYSYKGIDSVWAKCDQMRGVDVGRDWRAQRIACPRAPSS